jgi:purine catabolism regulator
VKLIDALQLKSFNGAEVVAGNLGLERMIRWVHVVDLPDPLPWVRAGDFLLTTGYAWPREELKQQAYIYDLAERGLAGMGLAVPHFFDSIPDAMRSAADDKDFPLIEIPWEIPFASITEEVHNSILAIHYELLEQTDSIHRELMRAVLVAESLQDIADTLGRMIGRTVMIEQPDGGVLAFYESTDIDQACRFAMEQGHGQAEVVAMYKYDYLKSLQSSTHPIRIPALPEVGLAARFVCPIHIKRDMVGLLWIVEGENALSELDVRSAEYAAIIMALHISQQKALALLEAQLGYSFLDSLQEGTFVTSQALKRARLLGFDPEDVYRVGILILDLQVPLSREGIIKRERLAEQLKLRLKELEIPALLSLSQNQISFLLPERCSAKRIWETLGAVDISFAVGRSHSGFSGVRQGYLEVCSMLQLIELGQIHHYEDLLIPRVLMGDEDARTSFLDKTFNPLRQTKNGDVLVQTLLAVAGSGFHLKKAAVALCVHPKTLRYRLDRVITLSGLNLDDSETQFNLQLAVRLLSLEDNKRT